MNETTHQAECPRSTFTPAEYAAFIGEDLPAPCTCPPACEHDRPVDGYQAFFCPTHAPTAAGWTRLPYDDGRPACSICGTANYAVKPFVFDTEDAIPSHRIGIVSGSLISGGHPLIMAANALHRGSLLVETAGTYCPDRNLAGMGYIGHDDAVFAERGTSFAAYLENPEEGRFVPVNSDHWTEWADDHRRAARAARIAASNFAGAR